MARPEKDTEIKRSHHITLRLSDAEFGKIGSNLNQIARYFHMGGIRSKAMQDEIYECISQIFDMRKEIAKMAVDYHGSVETHRKQKRSFQSNH